MEVPNDNNSKEEIPLAKRYKNIEVVGNGTFGIVYMVILYYNIG